MDYLVGLAKNTRLAALAKPLVEQAEVAFVATQEKQRFFGWLDYGAVSWDQPRRFILKAEHTDQGTNPRYLVTSLEGEARSLYGETYCARGEMEPTEGR